MASGPLGLSGAQKRNTRSAAAKKWLKDNDEALKKDYLESLGTDDPSYYDNLNWQDKWNHFEGRAVEGVEAFKEPPGIRQKLYERAGFSSPDDAGMMYGVVLKDKKGRAKVQALDINGDIDAQIEAAKAGSYVQPKIENFDDADSRRIIREGVSKDPERLRRWKRVESLEQMGVKPEWADHAAVVPEYFEPGARIPEPDFHPSVYEQLRGLDPDGGATLNPFTGETLPPGRWSPLMVQFWMM